ncbi:VOC family protein [Pseudonocardia phyllosphaerae]|uniref:VOC family protein n=1 Tax=Pseudonocardia phyllosphaerae TaxID=3390502 RepID=UPI0039793EDA
MEILTSRAILRPADPDAALVFYRDVLGLAIAREFPGGTVFFLGDGRLEVSATPSGAPDGASGSGGGLRLWLQVRDLAAAHTELADAGVEVLREPRREPWGLHEMWIADPDGTRIVLVQVPPDHPIRRDVRGDRPQGSTSPA